MKKVYSLRAVREDVPGMLLQATGSERGNSFEWSGNKAGTAKRGNI